jgi:hypothetical protein
VGSRAWICVQGVIGYVLCSDGDKRLLKGVAQGNDRVGSRGEGMCSRSDRVCAQEVGICAQGCAYRCAQKSDGLL